MPPTLVDIARETNTSVSTVSRVLSGGAMASRISRDTRERVQAAADRMGYRPNLLARSLRTRKTHTVALLVSDIANPFFGQIGSLVERALAPRGYSLMLCNTAEDADREAAYLRMVTAKGIDGLILVPLLRTREALGRHVPSELPTVILDRPIPGIAACVASDPEQTAGVLCDALARANVRRIAIVCGPGHVVTHRRRCEILSGRFEVMALHEGAAQKETGRRAALELAGVAVDAIVCTNNFLAQGVIDALAQVGRPPVIGVFDEIPMMHLLPMPIVSSMQDVGALAEGCVALLLKLLEGEAVTGATLLRARVVTNRAFDVRVVEG
jgi:DNA-binding LacI/PurR family transcriptional regulator